MVSMDQVQETGPALDRTEAFHRVSDVLKCKWALAVIDAAGNGAARPTEIKKAHPGLSDKVLGERLKMLTEFGLLERKAFAEVPPRVEYTLTSAGERLRDALGGLESVFEAWGVGVDGPAH